METCQTGLSSFLTQILTLLGLVFAETHIPLIISFISYFSFDNLLSSVNTAYICMGVATSPEIWETYQW